MSLLRSSWPLITVIASHAGDKPDNVAETMPNWRWRKLMSIAWFKMFAFLQADLAIGLCKQW